MFTKQNIITANQRVSKNLVKVQDISQENKLKSAKLNLDTLYSIFEMKRMKELVIKDLYTHTHTHTHGIVSGFTTHDVIFKINQKR